MGQNQQLQRVSDRISMAILDFRNTHRRQTFHAEELREYVASVIGPSAPGSADRILRMLRQQGEFSYRVVSRPNSLYRFF